MMDSQDVEKVMQRARKLAADLKRQAEVCPPHRAAEMEAQLAEMRRQVAELAEELGE